MIRKSLFPNYQLKIFGVFVIKSLRFMYQQRTLVYVRNDIHIVNIKLPSLCRAGRI